MRGRIVVYSEALLPLSNSELDKKHRRRSIVHETSASLSGTARVGEGKNNVSGEERSSGKHNVEMKMMSRDDDVAANHARCSPL